MMNQNDLPEASSRCPICGVDTPHEHDTATVAEYHENELYWGNKKLEEYQKLVAKRKAVDQKMLAELQRRVDAAIAAKDAYERMCPCCRIAQVGNEFIKDTIGTLIVYDYGWTTSAGGDIVHCPECGTCLWDET